MEDIIRATVWVEPQIITTLKTKRFTPKSSTIKDCRNLRGNLMKIITNSGISVITVKEDFLMKRNAWTVLWSREVLRTIVAVISAPIVSSPSTISSSSTILYTNTSVSEIEWVLRSILNQWLHRSYLLALLIPILSLNNKNVSKNQKVKSFLWIHSTNRKGLK